ncbi:MAG: beta-ketoacyl synthase chain length factor [Planctomycetota bacterium]|nr:beta-ketoacyl synthase chain length factor [Planctomycetota bacterium]
MSSPAVAITGLGLWMPGCPSIDEWVAGNRDGEAVKPAGLALDRVNRRRAGRHGRAIADAVAAAGEQAGVDLATVPMVVGSSVGEASTMVNLLDQLWRKKEPMSPAAFTVSVHNAASGLLSISNKNRGYTTSLAADEDTPAAALLEGIGLVVSGGCPVLVVCADEESPGPLAGSCPPWTQLAAAVVLAPEEAAENRLATVRVSFEGAASIAPSAAGDHMVHNPQIGMLDLIDAVLRRESGTLALDRGTGRGFMATLAPGGGA